MKYCKICGHKKTWNRLKKKYTCSNCVFQDAMDLRFGKNRKKLWD